MASVVSVSEFRAVLGVTTSLYSDAVLTDIIDSAEQIIGPMLTQHSVAIIEHSSLNNVWTNYTDRPHLFYIGQTVTVTDTHHLGVTATKTILEIPDPYKFTFTQTHADFDRHAVIPSGKAAANDLTQYDDVSAVESAILAISVDIFQSRIAPGGTQQALDYVPGPYRMGRSLLNRVIGLLGPYLDVESLIG